MGSNDEQPKGLRPDPADFGSHAATRGSNQPAIAPDGRRAFRAAACAADGLVRAGSLRRRRLPPYGQAPADHYYEQPQQQYYDQPPQHYGQPPPPTATSRWLRRRNRPCRGTESPVFCSAAPRGPRCWRVAALIATWQMGGVSTTPANTTGTPSQQVQVPLAPAPTQAPAPAGTACAQPAGRRAAAGAPATGACGSSRPPPRLVPNNPVPRQAPVSPTPESEPRGQAKNPED